MIHVAHSFSSPAGSSSSEDKYQSLRTDRMATRNLAIGMILLLQTTFGILGYFSLLYHYLFLYFTGCRLRSTDLIFKSLIVANLLVLFSSGIIYTMSPFGWYHIRNDFACRFFLYVRAVGRGVSIGNTCLLSVVQAVMISPMNSRWAEVKVKALKCLVSSIFLCWILQMLVNVIYPMFMSSNGSHKNITNRKSFGSCSAIRHGKTRDSLYAALLSLPDVFCLGLMIFASGCIVFILYRHKQSLQHILSTNVSSRSSPESRATKTILHLVSTFVSFDTLSSILQAVVALFNKPTWLLLNVNSVIILSFPSLSPFLLMGCESSVSRLCFTWIKNTKSPNLMRNM
ncbi:PREDICTED: LOW QUALITY PROTEIN: vomeronasal type-1 receptor 4-like [Ceratotherium simum simum]|uniref:Vomeronasal type-1 receptor n=1 Tax=Ceratotherium simum simum TaxID=73337 RepID=A0ABM1DDB9_CERSS|nr:PREDICTED: LOW QUALITY PROTEIN: vomeronasal type-1 receptor 4-like [Ceratotherium simum simum]